jgi:hypothetical protein
MVGPNFNFFIFFGPSFVGMEISMKIKLRPSGVESLARLIFIIASERPFEGLSSGLTRKSVHFHDLLWDTCHLVLVHTKSILVDII